MNEKLVYVGKIISLEPIPNADRIVSATVVCGSGGKWRGVVRKDQFSDGDFCMVFLPDSLVPPRDDMIFLKSSGWRVKMQKFRGAPSEVVIMPISNMPNEWHLGDDLTELNGVTKYHKPVPPHLNGRAVGSFPSFIPKTDELNYQGHPELVDSLVGKPCYITEKYDGSSTTAYRYKGHFGVCSRNLELVRDENNGYWKVAIKYKLEEILPEGLALQWETCGPGIQSNPMGLSDIDGFAFSAYLIPEKRYLESAEFRLLLHDLSFPGCRLLDILPCFTQKDRDKIDTLGEGTYKNGSQREGVVVRSQKNYGDHPISFKVINLNFEK